MHNEEAVHLHSVILLAVKKRTNDSSCQWGCGDRGNVYLLLMGVQTGALLKSMWRFIILQFRRCFLRLLLVNILYCLLPLATCMFLYLSSTNVFLPVACVDQCMLETYTFCLYFLKLLLTFMSNRILLSPAWPILVVRFGTRISTQLIEFFISTAIPTWALFSHVESLFTIWLTSLFQLSIFVPLKQSLLIF